MTLVTFLELGDGYNCQRCGVSVISRNRSIMFLGVKALATNGLKEVLSIQLSSLKYYDSH